METAKVLNAFFSNVVQNVNIFRFPDSDLLIWNIRDLTLKAILKYRKHPSIIATESRYRDVSSVSFMEINEANIEKEILNSNGNKASQTLICQLKLSKKIQIFLVVFYALVLTVQ